MFIIIIIIIIITINITDYQGVPSAAGYGHKRPGVSPTGQGMM